MPFLFGAHDLELHRTVGLIVFDFSRRGRGDAGGTNAKDRSPCAGKELSTRKIIGHLLFLGLHFLSVDILNQIPLFEDCFVALACAFLASASSFVFSRLWSVSDQCRHQRSQGAAALIVAVTILMVALL